jgi:mRNA-degrading endonuclease toxin of MazEF toxin-antitoxin module
MRRGDIRYADVGGGFGRRPVVILTADQLLPVLSEVMCAPVTTRLRGLATRVEVGRAEGLRERSEVVCEGIVLVEKRKIDTVPLGSIPQSGIGRLDRAISTALAIDPANIAEV